MRPPALHASIPANPTPISATPKHKPSQNLQLTSPHAAATSARPTYEFPLSFFRFPKATVSAASKTTALPASNKQSPRQPPPKYWDCVHPFLFPRFLDLATNSIFNSAGHARFHVLAARITSKKPKLPNIRLAVITPPISA